MCKTTHKTTAFAGESWKRYRTYVNHYYTNHYYRLIVGDNRINLEVMKQATFGEGEKHLSYLIDIN